MIGLIKLFATYATSKSKSNQIEYIIIIRYIGIMH